MLSYDFRMAFEYECVFDVRCMVLDTLQYLQIKHERKKGGRKPTIDVLLLVFKIFCLSFQCLYCVYLAKIGGGVNLSSYYHLTPASCFENDLVSVRGCDAYASLSGRAETVPNWVI